MNTNDSEELLLTEKQKTVAYEIVRSGREISAILEEHGVTEAEYSEWIIGGLFPNYTSYLAGIYARADEPFVWSKLFGLIRDGNIQAIKLFFSLIDKKNNGQQKSSAEPDERLNELRSDIFGEEESEV